MRTHQTSRRCFEQIGANARYLRHIEFIFPNEFYDDLLQPPAHTELVLERDYAHAIQLLRETCSDLRSFTIALWPERDNDLLVRDVDRTAAMLRVLDEAGLNAIQSLEEIVLAHYAEDSFEAVLARRESLLQRMPSRKWDFRLIVFPPEPFISDDDLYEFDDKDDCDRYNEEVRRREERKMRDREIMRAKRRFIEAMRPNPEKLWDGSDWDSRDEGDWDSGDEDLEFNSD